MTTSKIPKDQLKFVDPPTDEFICPICLGILQEPYLTACCGNHFCEACIEKVKKGANKCPLCQEKPLNGIINKNLRRKLNELKLYCIHTEAGCKWIGDLAKLEQHLAIGEIKGECQFIMVKCPVSELCNVMLARKSITDHANNVCQYRQFRCEHCCYQSTYLMITTEHYGQCLNYPMSCPNSCSNQTHPRGQLDTHLASCPEQEVDCTFSEMGCKEKMKRWVLQQHLAANMLQHQVIMFQAYCSVQQDKKKLEEQVACLKKDLDNLQTFTNKINWSFYLYKMSRVTSVLVVPVILEVPFRINYVKAKVIGFKNFAQTYYSPPFYTQPNGYKLQLSANFVCQDSKSIADYTYGYLGTSRSLSNRVNGMIHGVLVNLHIMKCEHDTKLNWPFENKISITLLNKETDDNHLKKENYFRGDKASQLILKDPNIKKYNVLKEEYEQLLRNVEPTKVLCKLWNIYFGVRRLTYPSNSLLFFLDDDSLKESKLYFEVALNLD